MKVILTEAGVDPVVWKPHAVRSAASSHHTTSRQLDLEQICRPADWSMASPTYLKFYKRYVWVLPPFYYCSYFGPPPSTESSVYLFIYLPRVTSHCELKYSHVCIFTLQINTANLLWMCIFYISFDWCSWWATRSSERYASFLLAPAEGWKPFYPIMLLLEAYVSKHIIYLCIYQGSI